MSENAPITDEESNGPANSLKSWAEKKFGKEHANWGIKRYSALLDLPPSVFPTISPQQVWNRFLGFEAKTDQDLTGLFPKPENRRELIIRACASLEWIKRRCFDWDYLLLPLSARLKYPTNQIYWDDREKIIDREFRYALKNNQFNKERLDSQEFVQAYWSELIFNFVSSRVMNAYTTLDLRFVQRYNKGGFHEYLEKYRWNIEEEYSHSKGKKATDKLVVHVLDRDSLNLALTTERLGQNTLGRVCFSEDRICLDFGYALIFRLAELQNIYPMYRVNEDPRDAHLLQEWRSPIAVDINLALTCIPTTEKYFGPIPKGQAWGTRVYGKKIIIGIKRKYKDLKQ